MRGLLAALVFLFTLQAAAVDYVPDRNLSGFEPSYMMYAVDDEDHIEFKISVKYPLFESSLGTLGEWIGGGNQVFFAYTGKYDFFLFSDEPSRQSAPVISRSQNPGIFLSNRRPRGDDIVLQRINVGWFHESNGQQITDNAAFIATQNASDFVSRGWDYLGVDFKFTSEDPNIVDGNLVTYLQFRLFCHCQGLGFIDDREDDVSVFSGAPDDTRIEDFDGLRLVINNYANRWLHYGLSLRTGVEDSDALRNVSLTFQLSWRLANVPVKLIYFSGYGKDLSTYHIRDRYLGIGFEFW